MTQVEEWLANHENRLSEIERLFPTLSAEDCKQIVKEVLAETLVKPEEWTTNQWDVIDQLRAEVKHIHGEAHKALKSNKGDNY